MFPATRSRRQALDDFEDGIVLKVEPREICRNRIFVKIDIFVQLSLPRSESSRVMYRFYTSPPCERAYIYI